MTTLIDDRITIGRPQPTGWRARLDQFDHSLDQTPAGRAVLRFGAKVDYSSPGRRWQHVVDEVDNSPAGKAVEKDIL